MKKRILSLILSAAMLITGSISSLAAPKTMPDGQVFDPQFYASSYPDVVNALGADENTLYAHYINSGRLEGRQPYAASNGPVYFLGNGAYTHPSGYTGFALNERERYISDLLLSGSNEIPLGNTMSRPEFDAIFTRVERNNPYYMMGITLIWNWGNDRVTFDTKYTAAQQAARQARLKALSQQIVANIISPGMNDVEKIKAIHNYIMSNTIYIYDLEDALQCLDEHIANCYAAAKAVKVLCTMAGIESYYIEGHANGGYHAWNAVKANGQWYYMDATPYTQSYGPINDNFYASRGMVNSALMTYDQMLSEGYVPDRTYLTFQ